MNWLFTECTVVRSADGFNRFNLIYYELFALGWLDTLGGFWQLDCYC